MEFCPECGTQLVDANEDGEDFQVCPNCRWDSGG